MLTKLWIWACHVQYIVESLALYQWDGFPNKVSVGGEFHISSWNSKASLHRSVFGSYQSLSGLFGFLRHAFSVFSFLLTVPFISNRVDFFFALLFFCCNLWKSEKQPTQCEMALQNLWRLIFHNFAMLIAQIKTTRRKSFDAARAHLQDVVTFGDALQWHEMYEFSHLKF